MRLIYEKSVPGRTGYALPRYDVPRAEVPDELRRAEPRLGARQFERIDVEADQASAGLDALEDRLRMTAAAERAVHRDLAGYRAQAAHHFADHDRPMRAPGDIVHVPVPSLEPIPQIRRGERAAASARVGESEGRRPSDKIVRECRPVR